MEQEFFELYIALPVWVQILDWIVFVIVVSAAVSLIVLFVAARRFERRARRLRDAGANAESDFLWIFLVPALNEEVTIADSVARLQQTQASNALFLVIDDGSEDATAEILAGLSDPRLRVFTRRAPDARRGKAAALNAAYRHIREVVLHEPEYAAWAEDRVVVAVVDADGRLDPAAPISAARHFLDAGVGGLQVLVRIYNRRGFLTWAQDVEFSTFGRIFQAGRAWWGTANLGGNGQFTRLSALASIDDDDGPSAGAGAGTGLGSGTGAAGSGPWRDRLTEDQDLGVRMIQAGWASVQDNAVTVEQQGLNSFRRLYRQRVRWAQGNWQSFSLLGGAGRVRAPLTGKIDSVYYLLTPLLQLLTGIAFVISIAIWLFDLAPHPLIRWWVIVLFLSLSFGPAVASLMLRSNRWYSLFLAIVLAIPYSVYSWMVFPVLAAALVRQISGRTSWAKTARESITGSEEPAPA